MNYLELIINNKRVNLYGSTAIINKEKPIIENLNLIGNEDKDRLLIQKCIDENNLKSDIVYEGNTVYPFKKIVKEYRRLQKNNSLENLTNNMYYFLINACGDIAHYNKFGYIDYYNNSVVELENRLLKKYILTRHSDVDKILKELKIGKYFKEREQIDLDKISIKELEKIIKECNWDIIKNNDKWSLKRNIIYENNFCFQVDVKDGKVSNIVEQIQNKYKSFNRDEYLEKIISVRNELGLTISEAIGATNRVQNLLSRLSFNVLYKSRLAVEEKNINEKDLIEKSDKNIEDDIEKGMEENDELEYNFG